MAKKGDKADEGDKEAARLKTQLEGAIVMEKPNVKWDDVAGKFPCHHIQIDGFLMQAQVYCGSTRKTRGSSSRGLLFLAVFSIGRCDNVCSGALSIAQALTASCLGPGALQDCWAPRRPSRRPSSCPAASHSSLSASGGRGRGSSSTALRALASRSSPRR